MGHCFAAAAPLRVRPGLVPHGRAAPEGERSMTLLITQEDVEQLFSPELALPIIEDAFRMAGEGSTENPAPFRLPLNRGFPQFGPVALHEKQVVGFKLWANFGIGPARGWNFLFSLGRVPMPDFKTSTTPFESHGLAIEDVAMSMRAYELARAKGLGREINLSLGKARSDIVSPGVDVPPLR
jgi:ornithine cyclodeaminase/alanine dehydrogenase-like protein (mu-crystallin family)